MASFIRPCLTPSNEGTQGAEFPFAQFHNVELFWDDYLEELQGLAEQGKQPTQPGTNAAVVPNGVRMDPYGVPMAQGVYQNILEQARPSSGRTRAAAAAAANHAGVSNHMSNSDMDASDGEQDLSGGSGGGSGHGKGGVLGVANGGVRAKSGSSGKGKTNRQQEQNKLAQKRYRERKKEKALAMERQVGESAGPSSLPLTGHARSL